MYFSISLCGYTTPLYSQSHWPIIFNEHQLSTPRRNPALPHSQDVLISLLPCNPSFVSPSYYHSTWNHRSTRNCTRNHYLASLQHLIRSHELVSTKPVRDSTSHAHPVELRMSVEIQGSLRLGSTTPGGLRCPTPALSGLTHCLAWLMGRMTSATLACDSCGHAHLVQVLKFEVPFLPNDPSIYYQ